MIALAEPRTVAEKSAACGVTEKTLRNWWALGCPKAASVEETLAWRDERFGKREAPESSDVRERKLLAETIKIEAEGRLKEFEEMTRRGEYVRRDAVERWLLSAVTEMRQTIESFTALVVAEIPGEHRLIVHDILAEQVRLLLLKLAAMREEMWADETIKEGE